MNEECKVLKITTFIEDTPLCIVVQQLQLDIRRHNLLLVHLLIHRRATSSGRSSDHLQAHYKESQNT
jgi:hypothetical protein